MSLLGVEDSGPWMTMMYFKGCICCSKVIKDEDELKNNLMKDNSVLRETIQSFVRLGGKRIILGIEMYFKGCTCCSKVIKDEDELKNDLMTDNSVLREAWWEKNNLRSYETSEIRRKSREALDAFKEVALHCQISDWTSSQNTNHQEKSSLVVYKGTPGHPRLQLSETTQKIKLKDKMSFMVINEDDLDIKIAQEVPSQTNGQSNDASPPPSQEVPLIGIVDPRSLPMETESALVCEEKQKSVGVEIGPSSPYKEDEGISHDKTRVRDEDIVELFSSNWCGFFQFMKGKFIPAEAETVISYNGDISVANILKFIANHGRILLTRAKVDGKNQDSPRVAAHEEGQSAKDKFHQVILKNQNPKKVATYNGGNSGSYISITRAKPHLRWWLVQSLLPRINFSRSSHLIIQRLSF
ncbi:hypothetical protein V6N11_081327 [Hibiscus sabdariffa]|uniref:Uncharacterized protein n=1 Tax=Hibiscus sabdariffa TaxID=183260 RepID=A0ABR2QJI9_9ROSI